ncbi:MAG: hypothetical protein CENE_02605 [Candidatus Celerinatantimonas neptuna]|nr:MAG: hypothetical protein CENE_02605 [Candidatus Celerinatantimonas neptuna]
MTNFGKSIRIFLADGSPAGLRHVEIVNWSGQALACPRARFSELGEWEESKRPGVYFLLEKASEDEGNTAYIGESEDVFKRLVNHAREKEFWNEVVIFTSKDENLTKSHIKYLEARLVALCQSVDRYVLENSNQPTKSGLPRADVAAMEEFIDYIKLVLGSLGHRLLEPVASTMMPNHQGALLPQYELCFVVNQLTAHGRMVDEGFLLLNGSQVVLNSSPSIPGRVEQIKQEWIENGILIAQNGYLELSKDKMMSSSSYAAALVAGNSRSGPQSWKTPSGESLKQLESRLVKANV